jgi:hypothetical protein
VGLWYFAGWWGICHPHYVWDKFPNAVRHSPKRSGEISLVGNETLRYAQGDNPVGMYVRLPDDIQKSQAG